MPTFDTATLPLKRRFLDMDFAVPAPFAADHVLSAPEAAWLNGQVASVVANQYGSDVRRALVEANAAAILASKGKPAADAYLKDNKRVPKDFTPATIESLGWDHQAKFLAKYTDYTLQPGRQGSGSAGSDPISRLVNVLASEAVKALILRKGLKVNDFMRTKVGEGEAETSKFLQLVAQYKDAHPELADTAKAQLEAAAAADAGDDFDLGLDEEDQIAA